MKFLSKSDCKVKPRSKFQAPRINLNIIGLSDLPVGQHSYLHAHTHIQTHATITGWGHTQTHTHTHTNIHTTTNQHTDLLFQLWDTNCVFTIISVICLPLFPYPLSTSRTLSIYLSIFKLSIFLHSCLYKNSWLKSTQKFLPFHCL